MLRKTLALLLVAALMSVVLMACREPYQPAMPTEPTTEAVTEATTEAATEPTTEAPTEPAPVPTEPNGGGNDVNNALPSYFPVTRREAMLTGTPVPSDVRFSEHTYHNNREMFITIADSFSQLKAIYTNDNPNEGNHNYTDGYTDAFFNDKAIVVLFIPEDSGSIRHDVELVRNGSVLGVNIGQYVPWAVEGEDFPVDTALATGRILLEVDRSDIAGITAIEHFSFGFFRQ